MPKANKKQIVENDSDEFDEEEDWEFFGGDSNNSSRKKLTEREREEELFRRMEENETQEMRSMIEKNLRDSSREAGLISDEELSPKPQKRLKVSEIFGESESEDSVKLDPEIDSLARLQSVRLTRNQLKEWAFMPFFSRRIPGFFVRVNIGVKNTEPVYRIAQIVGIEEEGTIYQFEDIKVKKRLRLSVCGHEKTFRMAFISNQPFTDQEYELFLEVHKKNEIGLPKMSEIDEKSEDLKFCMDYKLTSADIDQMVAEKSKVESIPKNYAFLRKKVANDLELAEMEGSMDDVVRLKKELEEINREYDKITAKNVERLKNEHISQEQWVQELEKRERLFEQEVLADRDKGDDPFTRRKTAPKMVQFLNSTTLKSESRQRLIEMRQNKGIPVTKPSNNNDGSTQNEKPCVPPVVDLCQLHDFELDISIDI